MLYAMANGFMCISFCFHKIREILQLKKRAWAFDKTGVAFVVNCGRLMRMQCGKTIALT